jgi:hypothetical protein
VIDSLFVRLGDVSSAALVFIGTTVAGLSATGFARVNILIALAGLATAFFVGRGYQGLTTSGERQKRVQPRAQPAKATAG